MVFYYEPPRPLNRKVVFFFRTCSVHDFPTMIPNHSFNFQIIKITLFGVSGVFGVCMICRSFSKPSFVRLKAFRFDLFVLSDSNFTAGLEATVAAPSPATARHRHLSWREGGGMS